MALAVAALALATPAAAAEPPVWVGAGRVEGELQAVARSAVDWLRHRIATAGLDAVATRSEGARTEALLDAAAAARAAHGVVLDLATESARVRVTLRLYDIAGRRLAGLGRAEAPIERVGSALDEALQHIAPLLGADLETEPSSALLGLPELAAGARAGARLDTDDLAGAWQELAGVPSVLAQPLRDRIERAAAEPGATAQRARLHVARGDMDTAWDTIATRAESADTTDVETLLAAGEVQLERGEVDAARDWFERALQRDPARAAAHLGLGRAFALTGDTEAARRAFERAAELEPAAVEPVQRQVDLASGDSSDRRGARRLPARDRDRWRHRSAAARRGPYPDRARCARGRRGGVRRGDRARP